MTSKVTALVTAKVPKLERKKMQTFKCQECDGRTTVQASLRRPHCVHCGSRKTTTLAPKTVVGNKLMASVADDVTSLHCTHCNTHMIMRKETVASHGEYDEERNEVVSTFHCPVCGEESKFSVANLDDFVDEGEDEESGISGVSLDEDHEDDTEDDEKASESEYEDIATSVIAGALGKEVNAKGADCDDDEDMDDKEDTDDDDSDDGKEAKKEEDTDDDDDSEMSGAIAVPVLSCVEGDHEFLTLEDKVFCMVDNSIVAWKEQDKEDENDKLIQVISDSVKEGHDLGDLLSSNGFYLSTLDVAYDDAISEVVEERTKKQNAEHKEKIDGLGDALKQSLTLSACGINRQFFNEDEGGNPLVEALVSRLVKEGADRDSAEVLVSQVMDGAADDYVERLRDKTLELMSYPAEARNALSETVMSVKHNASLSKDKDTENGKGVVSNIKALRPTSFKDRLASPIRASDKRTVTEEDEIETASGELLVTQLARRSRLFG